MNEVDSICQTAVEHNWQPQTLNPLGNWQGLLLCDHASRRIPPQYNNLGLADDLLDTHIGSDLGARALTLKMGQLLDAPAVMAPCSRLLVDYNRKPYQADFIPPVSDNIVIPGNQNLSQDEIEDRIQHWFTPYHRCIEEQIATQQKRMGVICLISVHSFTPQLRSAPSQRPWEVGVLWNRCQRLSQPIVEWLQGHLDTPVGRNQPYSGQQHAYTLDIHAQDANIAHCSFEIRQDLLDDSTGVDRWAQLLTQGLKEVVPAVLQQSVPVS